jgi:hypothetical protein
MVCTSERVVVWIFFFPSLSISLRLFPGDLYLAGETFYGKLGRPCIFEFTRLPPDSLDLPKVGRVVGFGCGLKHLSLVNEQGINLSLSEYCCLVLTLRRDLFDWRKQTGSTGRWKLQGSEEFHEAQEGWRSSRLENLLIVRV